jgi:hypothetical protein
LTLAEASCINKTDEDYNQAILDYEKDVAEGGHKEYTNYRGVEVK